MALARLLALLTLLVGLSLAPAAHSQTLLTEDFTEGTSSSYNGVGNWLFFNGACLTAGTSASLASPGISIPACTKVLASYYNLAADADKYLVGGANGFLGGTSAPGSVSSQQPDPIGSGALRFTNGKPYGNQERGAIVSSNAYSTSSGIQVTFKTVTYDGTGADGISFYLVDGCVPISGAIMPIASSGQPACGSSPIYPVSTNYAAAIGATGGSLAYSCSDSNGPSNGPNVSYDGLTGAYLGLGIDEYGNFLNQGDNTASGYGFQPGRIGLRGAGAISWYALNNAYGTNPGSSTKPYYPSSLANCPSGSSIDSNYNPNICVAACPTGGTYTASGSGGQEGSCATPVPASCPAGSSAITNYNGGTTCLNTVSCNFGYSYNSTQTSGYPAGYCVTGGGTKANPNTSTLTPASVSTTTPSTSLLASEIAVQHTCQTGYLYNYSSASAPTSAGTATLSNANNTAAILDYAPIPGAYTVLPTSNPLYNGSATTRSAATTIFYNLKITSDGYLSLSYAYNGGAYQQVIANQQISTSIGNVPAYVRFGFAGSTGGATNVHEILCFKSAPNTQASSSAGVNQKESAKVETGSFAYFAYYNEQNWVGTVTANALSTDSNGNVQISTTPTWDASCVLTGIPAGTTCSTGVAGAVAATTPASRVILTYNSGGVPFEWSSLSAAQQAALTQGDAISTPYRFNYLRGDRSNEVNSAGLCTGGSAVCFRARTSIVADIVDSSPTWVGPPQAPYTATWQDKLYPAATAPENAGTQSYQQFITAEQTRPNVVYVGSNDGMLHGFRAGAFDSSNNFSTAVTPNDGQEVIAYVPGSILLSPGTGGACASLATTGSIVQEIHGVTPAYSPAAACVTSALDYSNIQYGHNFFVDATPGTGDLFYSGTWHTWLVGGLGGGGAALYALDVTNPTPTNYAETNASSLVIGEWTSSTISCVGNTSCGKSLGSTYGTPLIRRLHDGRWAVIFGNGYGSANGDAGIFVMTIDSSGGKLFYYLSTGNTGTATNNGAAYVTAVDLDQDHVTDYVYAGDLMGNLWRFDLTSNVESNWAVTAGPMFTTASGQPITSAVTAFIGPTNAGANTMVVAFGTGQRKQFTNAAAVSYQTTTQSIYGVWDWNMTQWNSVSSVTLASLSAGATGLTGPGYTLAPANLQQQTFTLDSDNVTRDIVNPTAICWAGSSTCTGSPKFGWYVNLIGTQEQIIYNPEIAQGVFLVNSIVPANNQINACTTNTDTGFTYAITALTGAAPPTFFISYADSVASGVQYNATGTSSIVQSATGKSFLIFQTTSGKPPDPPPPVNLGALAKGKRLTWDQLR